MLVQNFYYLMQYKTFHQIFTNIKVSPAGLFGGKELCITLHPVTINETTMITKMKYNNFFTISSPWFLI